MKRKKIKLKESELRKLVLEYAFKTMNVEENFHTLIDEWINSSQEGTEEIEEGVVDAYDLEDFANQNDVHYTYFYNMLDYLKNVYDEPNPYERMNDIIQDYVTSKSNVITEDTLKLVIKECIDKYISEARLRYVENEPRAISFDKLKEHIKNEVNNPIRMAMKRPGEYTVDRMFQMLGKQPITNSEKKENVPYGKMSIYNANEISRQMKEIIGNWDVRNIDELLNFCKEFGIDIPSWLYDEYSIELNDNGWYIVETLY